MISTTTSGPRSTTQRKRQRLDQLVGRIAHLVGSAPISRIAGPKTAGVLIQNCAANKNKIVRHNNKISHLQRNNNNNSTTGQHKNQKNNNSEQEIGRICVSLSDDEEEEEDDDDDEEEDEEDTSVSMESGSGESPSPHQQQTVMSRLRMRGNLRHFHHPHHISHHLHPHHHGGQVFSFDHVVPVVSTSAAANSTAPASDDEGEEEVFSPGLGLTPTFSDRLTLSPCSQSSTTVDSPSGISFSPLSFADCCSDDPLSAAMAAMVGARNGHHLGITRSLTSDPATPLNLSTGGKTPSLAVQAGITPPHASSSPFHVPGRYPGGQLGHDELETSNRRRARSDSDLCDSDRLAGDTSPAAPAGPASKPAVPTSWVLTPANSHNGSRMTPPQSGSSTPASHHGHLAPRLSRLEHLRPPPLMVSLKRNSSDSTDSWSPLSGQQESPVDLSVRSGSSVSSDSPNQTSTNTSTASASSFELSSSSSYSVGGLETPPPPLPATSSRVGKSRGSRLKVLTRSLSLSQYLSAEYLASSVDLSGPDGTVSPLMPAPLMLPVSTPGFGCEICGQLFDQHDRLVKHLASRHKLPIQQQQQQQQHPVHQTNAGQSRNGDSGVVVKGYQCDVCQRPFARSDMLTRHMRLHTGLKPYTCRICGQVFSRSDHLSTHQRTHTGEKPYRCPQCSYAACRRDMITRHLRTHTRSEDLDGLSDPRKDSG